MKDDKVIYLVDIRDELQSFMHCEDIYDKWETVWEGWRAMNLRLRFRTPHFFTDAEKKGYIARKDAESLCYYIDNSHFWKVFR